MVNRVETAAALPCTAETGTARWEEVARIGSVAYRWPVAAGGVVDGRQLARFGRRLSIFHRHGVGERSSRSLLLERSRASSFPASAVPNSGTLFRRRGARRCRQRRDPRPLWRRTTPTTWELTLHPAAVVWLGYGDGTFGPPSTWVKYGQVSRCGSKRPTSIAMAASTSMVAGHDEWCYPCCSATETAPSSPGSRMGPARRNVSRSGGPQRGPAGPMLWWNHRERGRDSRPARARGRNVFSGQPTWS